MRSVVLSPDDVVRRSQGLRPPSATVVRLLNLLARPDAVYEDVIAWVEQDVALSVKLLAICNSARFGLAEPVASVSHAVLYLGFGEIHRLVMGLTFGEAVSAALPSYDMAAGSLWRHCLATARLTPRVAAIARRCVVDTSIAYTAGLLHDVGKLVLAPVLDGPARDRLHALVGSEGLPLREAEKIVLGCDHAEVGASLLRFWRIPEVLVEAVAHHHDPVSTGHGSLAALVHVADTVAHQTGASPGWASFAVRRCESAVRGLGLSAVELERLALLGWECQEQILREEGLRSEETTAMAPGAPVSAPTF